MWKNDGTNHTANGEFTDGDPQQGEPRSILGAKFLNMLLRELQNAVLDSGQELSEADEHQLFKAMRLASWPVGSIYETTNGGFDPNVEFGGTWVEFAPGRVLVGLDAEQTEFDTLLETGGAKTGTVNVTIPRDGWGSQQSSGQLPSPTTQGRLVVGSGASEGSEQFESLAHANHNQSVPSTSYSTLQPYTVIKRWHRTA